MIQIPARDVKNTDVVGFGVKKTGWGLIGVGGKASQTKSGIYKTPRQSKCGGANTMKTRKNNNKNKTKKIGPPKKRNAIQVI